MNRLVLVMVVALSVSVEAQEISNAKENNPRKEKIREALENPNKETHSDDPILDDVLQILKKRGSILDGSVLDPDAPVETEESLLDLRTSKGTPTVQRRAAYAAESLLRSARLLEAFDSKDIAHQNLVRLMRREAARILTRTYGLEGK